MLWIIFGNGINLNLYYIFYTVHRLGSFSKASEELYVTQPAISYSIKKLEEELNIKIFIRGSQPLQLTEEAKVLIPFVESSINSLKMGLDRLNDVKNLQMGIIKIGVPSYIGILLLVDVIKIFSEKYPEIMITVISKPTKELYKLICSNEIDFIVDIWPIEIDDDLNVQKISSETCCLACNKNRNSLNRKKISLQEIAVIPLIVPSKTSNSTRLLEEIYKKENVIFNPIYEIATSEMIVEMVEKDIGIGYIFERTVEKYNNLFKLDLNVELPKQDIYLLSKPKIISLSSQKFLDFLKSSIN